MKPIILTMCVMLLGSACLGESEMFRPPPEETTPPKNAPQLAVGDAQFAADLYARLAAEKTGNLFFSPGSIDTALAMTYAGAAGNTADQMAKTLHFTLPADKLSAAYAELIKTLNAPPEASLYDAATRKRVTAPVYQLTVANALWGQKGYAFKPDFIQLLQKSYGAGLNEVDFVKQTEQARKTINDWVAQQTKDKIKDLIAQGVLDDLTRLVLTNAVYFKSNWAQQFPKAATKDGPFKTTADKSVDVPLMHMTKEFRFMENDDFQMLELPYTSGALSMVILLPTKIDGLADMEKKITAADLDKWLKEMKSASVQVTLPKFKFSSDFRLDKTLKDMGMTDAFDLNKADFSGMTDKDKLYISAVIHKAFVAVDEDGTEAAAATAIVMATKSLALRPKSPKVFNADHPFVFLIRHNATGEILFMGRLANPKE